MLSDVNYDKLVTSFCIFTKRQKTTTHTVPRPQPRPQPQPAAPPIPHFWNHSAPRTPPPPRIIHRAPPITPQKHPKTYPRNIFTSAPTPTPPIPHASNQPHLTPTTPSPPHALPILSQCTTSSPRVYNARKILPF